MATQEILFCRTCNTSNVTVNASGGCASCGGPRSALEVHTARALDDTPTPREVDPRIVAETAAGLRIECGKREKGHDWQIVGCAILPSADNRAPLCNAIRICLNCSSFTYHTLQFIGTCDDTLEDRIHYHLQGGAQGEMAGASAGKVIQQGEKEGPDCAHCGANNWRTSERFEDIRVCLECEKPQMYRKPSKKKAL
jgi:hypothetical protein